MKNEYDFSKGKRGAISQTSQGKTLITLRLDDDIIDWFRSQVHATGGGDYQTLINSVLHNYMINQAQPKKGLPT